MKQSKGKIKNWWKHYPDKCWGSEGLGYIICGTFVDHPDFDGKSGCTSFVTQHNEELGVVETLNSYYTLIGPPIKEPVHA